MDLVKLESPTAILDQTFVPNTDPVSWDEIKARVNVDSRFWITFLLTHTSYSLF